MKTQKLETSFQVIIRFQDRDSAEHAARRIAYELGYITHAQEVAT